MGFSKVIKGAEIKLLIGGKVYAEVQSISYSINYSETEIFGIDSIFAQEIKTDRVTCSGTISGVRVKLTGGLQGYDLRPRINEILHAPYVSLEIRDRQTDTKLLWLPQMKVTSENFSVTAKGILKINFSFKGIIPYGEMDISGKTPKQTLISLFA